VEYKVQLEFFEGPLDLLLHLIKKEEVDIYDIPVAKITEQYLEYIHSIQKLDLEVTSEFLVMAATLISIKSNMLLPQTKKEEEEDGLDPREELVRHLIEYQKYKEAAQELKRRANIQENYLTRPVDTEAWKNFFTPEDPPLGVELDNLVAAFRKVLKRNPEAVTRTVKIRKVTIAGRMELIKNKLKENPSGIIFSNLFEDVFSIQSIVVTFIALLELARLQHVILLQHKTFGEITILPWQGEVGEG
jgi:segregation and condensation protein A